MSVSDNKQPSAEEQMANLLAVMEKLVSVVATIQGNQGQLTIAFNQLQSEKLAATLGDKPTSASATASASTNSDATIHTTKFGHKLMFLTYDGLDDPLQWLNHCDQFFRVQETPPAGKVFLTTFYMTGEASQRYTLLQRNRGTPSWEFTQLVNKCFGPPL
jgi:hypothetical protein